MSSNNYVILTPSQIDTSRIVINKAFKNEFTGKDNKVITNYRSNIRYKRGGDSKEVDLYISAPEQSTFGFSRQYAYGKESLIENTKGMQLMYPLTSLQTADNPTDEEKSLINVFDTLDTLAHSALKAEKDGGDSVLPKNTLRGFEPDNVYETIKKSHKHPNVKDTKTPDTSKPTRMYLRLVTKGKGKQLVVNTKVYGPGNKLTSAFVYTGSPDRTVRGKALPLIHVNHVYWGAHGDNPQVGHIRYDVIQCNFTPTRGGSSVPSRQLLPMNTAPIEEDSDGEEFDHPVIEDDNEDDVFTPSTSSTKTTPQGDSEVVKEAEEEAEEEAEKPKKKKKVLKKKK